jgi:hypothetical protein
VKVKSLMHQLCALSHSVVARATTGKAKDRIGRYGRREEMTAGISLANGGLWALVQQIGYAALKTII